MANVREMMKDKFEELSPNTCAVVIIMDSTIVQCGDVVMNINTQVAKDKIREICTSAMKMFGGAYAVCCCEDGYMKIMQDQEIITEKISM